MSFNRVHMAISIVLISSVSFATNADTLTDVKSKLETLNGDSPLNVEFTSKYTENNGKKGENAKNGLITLPLSYNHNGLQITYNKGILEKVSKEEALKEQDESANTPTLSAMSRIESSDLLEKMSSAQSLLRFLNRAELANEKQIEHQGKTAIELNFNLPIDSIITGEDTREYIDEFEGQYRLVVDNQGIPIESELTFSGSGSAYVFFNLEMEQISTSQYQVVGNRLVNTSQAYKRKQSSTFGDSESVGEETLAIITNNLVGNAQGKLEIGSCKQS